MDSLQMIELILNDGRKSSTYKYALLLSIIDYVIENPLENPMNNFHYIPLIYLAKQFLAYYFPFTLMQIKQGTYSGSETGIAIATDIEGFIQKTKDKKVFPFSIIIPENTNRLVSFIDDNEDIPSELIKNLVSIREKILKMPIKHIRNIKSLKISFFSVLTENISILESYEKHRLAGINLKLYDKKQFPIKWSNLLNNEKCYLFFSSQTYQEIAKVRFWLRDVLIKRWAQECIKRDKKIKHPNLLSIFDMWKIIPDRDYSITKKYRQFFIENKMTKCLYCQKDCKNNFEIDHLFPWSKFPINSFWNLYPACKNCNSKKLDKVPQLTNNILDRIQQHILICLNSKSILIDLVSNDITKLYQKWFHSKSEDSNHDMKSKEIRSIISRISQNLLETTPGNTINLRLLE